MFVRKADKNDIIKIQEVAEAAWRPTYLHIIGEEQCTYMLEWMYNSQKLEEQIDQDTILVDRKSRMRSRRLCCF